MRVPRRDGRRAVEAGRLQFPGPADPVGQVLQVPRPRRRKRKAELRLDTRRGPSARPSRAPAPSCRATSRTASSTERITAEDEIERMPPKSLGRTLSPEEIDILKRWIEQGAEWKPHWAFLPPVAAAAPRRQGPGLAPQSARPVRPGPPGGRAADARPRGRQGAADPPRHLRPDRLPPTLAEIDAFLADRGPDAYERLVDRLLASPRFGERMAVDWLDLARYADTYGYQSDVYRAMWPWRDWVDPGVQRQPALRPVHHLATGRRPAPRADPRRRSSPRRSTATTARPTRGEASRRSSASSTSPTGPTPSRPRSSA